MVAKDFLNSYGHYILQKLGLYLEPLDYKSTTCQNAYKTVLVYIFMSKYWPHFDTMKFADSCMKYLINFNEVNPGGANHNCSKGAGPVFGSSHIFYITRYTTQAAVR